MFSVFNKEIKLFLGSLTGYLVMVVFLLVSGLFLWVFQGNFNIPENGYATLEGFFELAPWLYLFLIPAITMRFFADERRSGTLEVLLTRPISDFKLVFAKFSAGIVLVMFTLLPTLIWFLSVYLLGNPVGSIDTGATWGSFIGLFFLAAIYLAIGIFASSLTDNQMISFLLALAFSFIFNLGLDFAASSGIPYLFEQLLLYFSINNHYQSISRGVADMRDLVYFAGMALFFLVLTASLLRKGQWKLRAVKFKMAGFSAGLLAVFFISTNFLFRIDLTADKRFSLSEVSKAITSSISNSIEVELYLEGELEPGLQKLQQEIFEKIAVLNVYAPKPIRIRSIDPYLFSNDKKRETFQNELIEKGIKPISFRKKTDQGVSTRYIFPGAVIRSGEKETAVNFLQNNSDFTGVINLNHSIENVEFELINAFQKLARTTKSKVAFLQGHGELNAYEVLDFSNALKGDFEVSQANTNILQNDSKPEILIIAGPTQPFSDSDKYLIDQFLMQGGKLMCLIDPVQVSPDSLSNGYLTYAFPRDISLSDQLFKYGVRLNNELLQDVDCARILVNTAPQGSPDQWTMHPWYYSPLLTPADNHPLSRNLNRVFTEFVSSIDTVSGNGNVAKTVILSTSPYARSVKSPSSVSLENINNPPARELFTKSFIPVGVLLEGEFSSLFENRMIEDLGVGTLHFLPKSNPTKMIVIADAGIVTNKVNEATQPPQIMELGYDRVSKQTFGNKEFLMNAMYYLNDDAGIMELRSRTMQLRLLDKVRLREQKNLWQWINVLAPLLLISLFGMCYNLLRRYRFSRL